MRVEALSQTGAEAFLAFCRKHRGDLDDSYLIDEELAGFGLSPENPTYIVAGSAGEVTAAASLILNDYSRRGRKARFRIFHAESAGPDVYEALLQAILPHTAGMDKLNIFVPAVNAAAMAALEAAGFSVERYTYVLVRESLELPDFSLPPGYEIIPFRPGQDEAVWCEVRNAGFAKLQGNETPATPAMVKQMISGPDYIDGGLLILYHNGTAVGIVRGSADEYEGAPAMSVGPLAMLPEYQGRGLGRILLRAALRFAGEQSYSRSILCVNAENERAQVLYTGEGFKQVEAVACLAYPLILAGSNDNLS